MEPFLAFLRAENFREAQISVAQARLAELETRHFDITLDRELSEQSVHSSDEIQMLEKTINQLRAELDRLQGGPNE